MFNPGAKHRLRMIPFHTIRWMGRKNSVAKILEALKELLTYFENLKVQEGNHIYDHLRDYRVLHFTFSMDDLLAELHTITRRNKVFTIQSQK